MSAITFQPSQQMTSFICTSYLLNAGRYANIGDKSGQESCVDWGSLASVSNETFNLNPRTEITITETSPHAV